METKAIFVGFTVPPALEDIEQIADHILDDMPEGFSKYVQNLKVQVEDFPDDFIQQELEVETAFDLLGCYQSAGPVIKNGNIGAQKRQDTLFLYRRPILDVWADTNDDLSRIVNRVILREIGHHFGFSSDELEMYEEDMFGATASGKNIG